MQFAYHPHVGRDLQAIAEHVATVSGSRAAAGRRLDEIDKLVAEIGRSPNSGARIGNGWLVRHGGAGQKITIVFRLDDSRDCVQIAIIAFGRQNWEPKASQRAGHWYK